jgi:hypothetical protein
MLRPSRRASCADIAFSSDPVSGVVEYREPLMIIGKYLFNRRIFDPALAAILAA